MAERYQHLFDTEHLKGDLKKKSIRGGAASLGSEAVTFVLRVGSTAVLARLLVPADFGLVSMVTALTGLAQLFKDLGLSDATIQNKEIDHGKLSSLFWINAGIGLAITLAIAASAPLVAAFYHEPRLAGITLAISTCFLFSGLTVQHQALLYRQMRFSQVAVINIVSTALGIVAAVVMAWRGYGYWALVVKEISSAAFLAAGTWRLCRWVPGLPKRGAGVSSLLRFGRDVTGFNIVIYVSRSIDRVLIGRNWGAAVLGIYDRALQLMLLPLNQIRFPMTRVGMSGLSALQDSPDRYREYYSKLVSIMCFIYMPIVVYLGVFSRLFIRLLLGEPWMAASDIFRVLALVAFVQPVLSTCDLILMSQGRTKRYFLFGALYTICIVIGVAVGVRWGSMGVAVAYAVVNYLLFMPSLWYKLPGSPVSVRLFFRSIASPSAASLFMGALLAVISPLFAPSGLIGAIVLSFLAGAAAYAGAWLLMPGGKRLLTEYLSYVRDLLRTGGERGGEQSP